MLTVALVHGREKTPLPGAVSLQKSVGLPMSAKKMSGKRGVKPQPPQPHCDVMGSYERECEFGCRDFVGDGAATTACAKFERDGQLTPR